MGAAQTPPRGCRLDPLDDLVLVNPCAADGQYPPGLHHLVVDDFRDPDEVEIMADEIHVSCFKDGAGVDLDDRLPFCFKLSVASARSLIERLEQAIRVRDPHYRGGEGGR